MKDAYDEHLKKSSGDRGVWPGPEVKWILEINSPSSIKPLDYIWRQINEGSWQVVYSGLYGKIWEPANGLITSHPYSYYEHATFRALKDEEVFLITL